MGGDKPPEMLFQAVLEAASSLDSEFEVYLSEQYISPFNNKALGSRGIIAFTPSDQIINAEDPPLEAIREKPRSSLALGLSDLKEGEIDALVSIGNTGALVAGANLKLDKIPGVARPGLLALLPTRKGVLAVIDVGANVACKPSHLLEFARLGAVYMQKRYQIEKPAVGLLNIGAESLKGGKELQEAYQLIEASDLHFVGNVEGTVAFEGEVDVLVTDGFSGNVFLKASEGMASFIFEEGSLEPRFNYEEYPGALLCGLEKIVVKCHGNSGSKALYSGIEGAYNYLQSNLIQGLKESFQA